MKQFMFIFLLAGFLGCSPGVEKGQGPEKPDHIILFIGDGMGLSAVSAGFYFGEQPSVFSRFEQIGLINTSSATHLITESAAAGTALATGHKTYNGAIGVDTSKTPVPNISEFVSDLGWSTGVVATSSITHATPASFYAHVEQRSMEEEIAHQLLDSEIDFFAGGGIQFFHHRSDNVNLFDLAGEKGFLVDTTLLPDPTLLSPENKYGYVLAHEGMPSILRGRGDFLPEATALAIDYLSKDQDGFFLMVEGSQIDWAGHDNESDRYIAEVLDMAKAIETALEFADKKGNTLVVVTADHETGGFALSGKYNERTDNNDYRVLGPSFSTGGHTATLIPVFAYGPGAERFTGIYQNCGIYSRMVELLEAN
jgi:alkaline phosphatase